IDEDPGNGTADGALTAEAAVTLGEAPTRLAFGNGGSLLFVTQASGSIEAVAVETGGLTAGDTITIPVGTELKMVIVSDNDSDFEEVFNVSGEDVSGGSGTDRQLLSGDEPFSVMRLDVNGNPEEVTYDPNHDLGVVFDNDYFFMATAVLPDGTVVNDVAVSFIRLDDTPPPPGETGPHDGEIVGFFTQPFLPAGSTLTLGAGTDGGVTVPYAAIPCFASGSMIATPDGERAVEDIAPGDQVLTRDNGVQTVRWAGSRQTPAYGDAAPVRIRSGALGNARDLVVSPQHRMLLSGWRAETMFGETEVLIAATHLTCMDSVSRQEGGVVTYHHLLFDAHEIIFAEGAATESLHPGDLALSGFDQAARAEVLSIFPELASGAGPTARPVLRGYEARALFA
ncbi:MAG: Hint domain-containing protein, partial [Pseudomonadota bacterium]